MTAFTLVCCMLLGGGTRPGFFSDTAVQVISIPLLLMALARMTHWPMPLASQDALVFCLAITAIPILQLIPMPPNLWATLPGREILQSAFELPGRTVQWMPLSVSPRATWLNLCALLPPLSIFTATLMSTNRQRRWLTLVLLGIGLVSVCVGLLQVAQGPSSPLRPFAITNPREAVGFFANRNHFAALLYCVLLYAAAWTCDAVTGRGAQGSSGAGTARLIGSIAGFTAIVVLVSAQALARSRAGLGLTMVALLGAFAIASVGGSHKSSSMYRRILVSAITLAAIFATQFILYRVMERFAGDSLEDARIVFARNTLVASMSFTPFGSGLGSFLTVYGAFEKPADALVDTYANHAHNDVLELWLEAGAAGFALTLLFVFWLLRRTYRLWRKAAKPGGGEIDLLLARASSLIAVLLIAHSFVDYPLHTEAMMSVMGFACGLMLDPPAALEKLDRAAGHSRSKLARAPGNEPARSASAPAVPESEWAPRPQRPNAATVRWGNDIEWPEAWRKEPSKEASPEPIEKTPTTDKS